MSELDNLRNEETQDTSYDHVLRYTGVFGGVQGLKLLMSVLRNKLTSVLLGGAGLGLISIYNAISEFIVSSCNFGIPLNATRITGELFENGTKERIEYFVTLVRTCVLWSAILAAVLCALFSPLLSYAFFEHDWRRFPEVMLIIPVTVCFLVAEGECAILKGLRQTRKVAAIETAVCILTLLLTVPFYYLWGLGGVWMGLLASGLASVACHFHYSLPLVNYKVMPFNRSTFSQGLPVIRKGIPYVLAGIANSGLRMFVPAMLLWGGTLEEVGYFNAGFAITAGYAGVAFVALEADYYPRLASVCHSVKRMNETINQQIDVCVLFLTPLLVAFVMLVPWVIRLLYTGEFMVIRDMAVCAVFYVFMRAVYLPVGYVTLAKGESLVYFAMELAYDVFFALAVYFLYRMWGLTGAGVALSLGALYDVVCSLLVYGKLYACRIRRSTAVICLVQFVPLFATVMCSFCENPIVKYAVGIAAFIASTTFSLNRLSHRSDFLRRIRHHFRNSSGDCC